MPFGTFEMPQHGRSKILLSSLTCPVNRESRKEKSLAALPKGQPVARHSAVRRGPKHQAKPEARRACWTVVDVVRLRQSSGGSASLLRALSHDCQSRFVSWRRDTDGAGLTVAAVTFVVSAVRDDLAHDPRRRSSTASLTQRRQPSTGSPPSMAAAASSILRCCLF